MNALNTTFGDLAALMNDISVITHAIQTAKHPRAYDRAERDRAIAVLTAWCDAHPKSLLARDRRLWVADLVEWQAKLDAAQGDIDALYNTLREVR
jgi:hypothetical protein